MEKEADCWFERNKDTLLQREEDIVVNILERLQLQPCDVLEIGCANGYRLDMIRRRWGARTVGIDPSAKAVEDGRARYGEVQLLRGTADSIPLKDQSFDMVIFGFCLYLVDAENYLKTVAEADRVLRDGGFLVIFDFLEPYPYRNPYAHKEGVYSRKMDFSQLFLAHPAYTLIHRELDRKEKNFWQHDTRSGVDILYKDLGHSFPLLSR